MRHDLLPKTFDGKMARMVEEIGEVLKAVGKLQRFGFVAHDAATGLNYNNKEDLLAEMADLDHAMKAVSLELVIA